MSADLSQDPRLVEPAAVFEWTSRHVPDDADAVFIGGNGFRAAGAIGALEATIGRPVLTSNQVLLWSLLALVGATFHVTGYGQPFAHRPVAHGLLLADSFVQAAGLDPLVPYLRFADQAVELCHELDKIEH